MKQLPATRQIQPRARLRSRPGGPGRGGLRTRVLAVAVIALALPALHAAAQTSRPARGPIPLRRPPAATPPAPPRFPLRAAGPAPHRGTPLLREGSYLVGVTGSLRRDATGEAWIFVVDPDDDSPSPPPELTILPCTLLAETERMIESSPDHRLVFELTGRVYAYHNRNYLLPTDPPLLVAHVPAESEGGPASPPDERPSPSSRAETEPDTAADIIRSLERAVGPTARRRVAGRRANPDSGAREAPPMLEDTVLVERRGVIRRTGSGGYLFILDADAEGLADPPLRLLPCLLLSRIEGYARRAGEHAAVLLSGHVYTYHGRNYLLPSVFRVPFDRTVLHP